MKTEITTTANAANSLSDTEYQNATIFGEYALNMVKATMKLHESFNRRNVTPADIKRLECAFHNLIGLAKEYME